MVCAGLETLTETGLVAILSYPTSCDYYFYGKLMGAIFIILGLTLYYGDKDRFIKADMVSSLGVSAMATIFISLIGTLLGIIQADVFIEIVVIGLIFIALWIFKK